MEEGMRLTAATSGKPAGQGQNLQEVGNPLEADGMGTESAGVDGPGAEPRQGADGLLAAVREAFPGKRQDIRSYSPLTLAYIGDAVYDLVIRTMVVEKANRPANDLHHYTVRYVSANAQSRIVQGLMDRLTEEEQSVYRRGRNSKPHTMAKNATVADYLKATGFEAVLGYLYLTDRMERALELVKEGVALIDGAGR